MKQTISFDLFEQGQDIYFDILRLAEIEKVLGKGINKIVQEQDAGIGFCLAALQIGMRHHYPRGTQEMYAIKIENYLDGGGRIDDVATPIIMAILKSGIFGKEVGEKIDEVAETEKKKPAKRSPIG